MKNVTLKLGTLSLAVLAALGSTGVAIAAEEEAKKKEFEVIVVTAQKRSQSINDVPMAITAFSGEDLAEMGIEDTTDIANVIPGFNFSETAFGPPVYTLRGVGFNESSAQATSTVGVYVDEIAVPFPIMTKGANIDLERVEVLKGPQGTLYGRNSTAGAVNYIAAKPEEIFEASLRATTGSFETSSIEGFITNSLSDSANGRFAFKKIKSGEGWQEHRVTGETLGRQDKLALRATIDFELSDSTSAIVSVSHSSDKSESTAPQSLDYIPGMAGGAPFSAAIYAGTYNLDANPGAFTGLGEDSSIVEWTIGRTPAVNHKNNAFSLNITHELSDTMSLTSLTGYSKFEDNGSEYERAGAPGATVLDILNNPFSAYTAANFGSGFEGFLRGRYANAPDSEHVTMDYVYQNGSIDSFSQEIRIAETTDDVSWMTGVYFSRSEVDYQTVQDWGVSSNVNILPIPGYGFNGIENDVNQETSTIAVFFNADWTISDDLTVTTGIRYSKDTADYEGCSRDLDGGVIDTFENFFFGGADSGATRGNGVTAGSCGTVVDFATASQHLGAFIDTLEEDSLSWRLASNYQVNDEVSVYTSYSRGFKAGSYPSLAALTDQQLLPVVQEQLDAYEVGFKSVLLENTLRLNASAFYYDYKDKQLLTKKIIPVFRTAFTLGNMDESSVSGVELNAQWIATDNLTISVATSWLDSEIKKGEGFNQLGQNVDFAGSPLPFSAEFQSNIVANYEWDISGDMTGFIAVDASYSGESHADFEGKTNTTLPVADFLGEAYEVVIDAGPYAFDERFINKSYTLINARAGIITDIGEGAFKGYIWGRNITDEYYTTSILKNNEMLTAYPGMGASYGVTVEYTWF